MKGKNALTRLALIGFAAAAAATCDGDRRVISPNDVYHRLGLTEGTETANIELYGRLCDFNKRLNAARTGSVNDFLNSELRSDNAFLENDNSNPTPSVRLTVRDIGVSVPVPKDYIQGGFLRNSIHPTGSGTSVYDELTEAVRQQMQGVDSAWKSALKRPGKAFPYELVCHDVYGVMALDITPRYNPDTREVE